MNLFAVILISCVAILGVYEIVGFVRDIKNRKNKSAASNGLKGDKE